jgi:alkylation response protein AidB-like acyl-CoA dehydrogenase
VQRHLYDPDHEAYRETVREFLAREVAPRQHDWDREHWIDRGVFARATKAGIYALSFGLTVSLQDDLVLHYLIDLTNDEQKLRWLPGFASGEIIGALAMTEPGAGSDLQGMRTTARRDGDSWILNGQKTFISSGIMADVIVVAARTNPEGGSSAFSLFVVERGTPGFERGRQLEKIGLPGQDTAETVRHSASH